jgi:hypothetical protein
VTFGIVVLPLALAGAPLAATRCLAAARGRDAVNLAAAFQHGHPHRRIAGGFQYCYISMQPFPVSSIDGEAVEPAKRPRFYGSAARRGSACRLSMA